ncbi:hypothetical protein [Dyella lutea]|uniref:Lipoprotein n=1 Tax=Dyella lutea TaxID=2950441 RepID=A0ABT1FJ05_9GAMM|nr:hypothetical protein [Dyella lutea]MCP1376142.1 hypothetical protein [Dyella lutea]
MKLRPMIVALSAALMLAACSGKPPAPRAAQDAHAKRVATPWDGMKKDEQRAKDVQKVVDEQAAEQRKQIEADSQ